MPTTYDTCVNTEIDFWKLVTSCSAIEINFTFAYYIYIRWGIFGGILQKIF